MEVKGVEVEFKVEEVGSSRSIFRLADGGRVAQVEENAWGRAGVSGG